MPAQTITLDRALTARTQFVVVWSFVNNRRVRKGDPGHVRRVHGDADIALRRNHSAPDMFRAKFVTRDERILVRSDVVIIVRPIVDALAMIEPRLGRQRRPTNVILARPPRNPGGRPFIARYPDPADATQSHPATVVIRGPAERFVGNPGPAGVAIHPAAFGVRPPIARFFCYARLPDIAVLVSLPPITIRIEFLIKHSIRGGRASLRPRFGWFHLGQNLRRGRGFRDGRVGRSLPVGERLFARGEIGLLLRQPLLVRIEPLGCEPVLDLAFNLGFSFLLGLLFLARNENSQRGDERENGELLHGVIRQGDHQVIRTNRGRALPRAPYRTYFVGAGDGGGVAVTGVIVTFSMRSRRAFCTFA